MGRNNDLVGVTVENGKRYIALEDMDGRKTVSPIDAEKVWLRLKFDSNSNIFVFSYSIDGEEFLPAGQIFTAWFGHWKGARPALFSFNTVDSSGTAFFDDFIYQRDK